MRISGTETSSVILSQKEVSKVGNCVVPKVSKQVKAKRDGVISSQSYICAFRVLNPRNYIHRYISFVKAKFKKTKQV